MEQTAAMSAGQFAKRLTRSIGPLTQGGGRAQHCNGQLNSKSRSPVGQSQTRANDGGFDAAVAAFKCAIVTATTTARCAFAASVITTTAIAVRDASAAEAKCRRLAMLMLALAGGGVVGW